MFILLNWVKYYTKEATKALKIMAFGIGIILTVIIIKYKPAYEVTLSGKKLGFIENREKIEKQIKDYIEDTSGNIAFREQYQKPNYELKLINRSKKIEKESVMIAVKDSIKTTYKTYAIIVDGNPQVSVASEEEAKNAIDQMKTDLDEDIELNVGIIEQYTTDLKLETQEEVSNILDTIKIAKISEYENKQKETNKKENLDKRVVGISTIAGINLSRPVNGSITSRYGSRSSVRSRAHTGLDIATSSGTPITSIASGTVTYADYKGSYGNLVIIDHGNGIESYYAHCSKILVDKGEEVECSTVIAKVGSTGNSTGPHLHLEIRQNGDTLNPEDYLY